MTEENDVLTPPWYWRTAYRLFFRRLPEEYGPWVAQDLTAKGWQLRVTLTKYLNLLVLIGAFLGIWYAVIGSVPLPLLGLFGFLVLLMPFEYVRSYRRPVSARREILDHQSIDRAGNPVPEKVGMFTPLRRRLLPRRENEAIAYLVGVVLVLNATAAFAFSKRKPEPEGGISAIKAECVKVKDDIRAAVEETLKPGAKITKIGASRYDDGVAVGASVDAPGDNNPTPLVIWLVRGEGRGYRVNVASWPGDASAVTTAATVDVGVGRDLDGDKKKLWDASVGASQCVLQNTPR